MRLLALLILALAIPLNAQKLKVAELTALKPRSIGPASMSGRVTSIAVVRNEPNIIYIGTASGGVWKSTSGGTSWTPIFDTMQTGSIGAVAVQQNNPDIIWVGTGEGNPRNSHNSGVGIFKSLDGGRTWTRKGLELTKTIHRIIINPENGNEIYVAAMGSIWGPTQDRGVYKTTDGGNTWSKVLYVNDLSGCAELVMDPKNPQKIFAAMWEFERKPYTFTSGGKGSGLYMTINGGKDWKKLGENEGLPSGILGRMGLAIAPSNSQKVYAMIESKKLEMYSSDNGGYNWKKISDESNMGNRPFYYSDILADPSNENHIISLWSQVTHSIDGGKTWQTLLDWGHIHPDHHAFYIHPDNPKLMIDGNDGGLNISTDGGKNWRYCANLPIGQFYHVNVDNEFPYNVYGGLQDNGSWKGPGYVLKQGGIRNSDWKEILFGDGFDVIPLKNNPYKGYAAWQGGNLYFYNLKNGKTQSIQPVHPEGKFLRFNWNAAMAVPGYLYKSKELETDSSKVNTIYYGSQFLHKSLNNGMTWEIISPDLTTNDTSKLHQAKSGGLTIDATNAENYCTIIAIAPSAQDENVIWVGTDDGNLQLTKDGGKSWQLLNSKITGAPKNAWIPFIHLSQNNPGEAWVIMNNYRQNDWQPYLFRTRDYGQTWKRMVNGNQVSGHCLSVFQDPQEPKLIWLGTDHGLFISMDEGLTWNKWVNGFPSCPVQDIVYQNSDDDLIVGTFGRSIYVFDELETLRKMAGGIGTGKELRIFSACTGKLSSWTRPDGERFGADAFFEGSNKAFGSDFFFYTPGNKKAGKWENTKITCTIYKDNAKIRTFKLSYDSAGIYRFQWKLHADGFRFPSHHTQKNDEILPEGLLVSPGEYLLVMQQDKQKDSIRFSVVSPLDDYNERAQQIRLKLYQRLKEITNRAFDAFEGLKDAEEMLKSVTGAEYENDSASKRLTKLSGPLKDTIEALKLMFMQAKNVHYYEDITVRVNDLLYAAFGYIQNNEIPEKNAENAVNNAGKFTSSVISRVNRFFENDWISFVKEVEKEKRKTFKPVGNY